MDKKTLNGHNEKLDSLLESLLSEDGTERKNARKKLVSKGKIVINHMGKLLNHPKHLYRWEAVKTLEELALPDSIPYLIQALNDDKSDIRWIAAEGLIRLEMQSVKPVLEALMKKNDSVFLLEGAHHIFFELKEKNVLPKNFPIDELLALLKNSELKESAKLLAYKIINQFKL
ncbi:HEAT repeat domain-containing protein [Melioribacteraceae bacterium 4301-Me]|uniref:HEAT repeat domain-containing protein n=1 Tax=Pyranulibacter aquaticus TaxID=3163344 RepID=UPI00359A5250